MVLTMNWNKDDYDDCDADDQKETQISLQSKIIAKLLSFVISFHFCELQTVHTHKSVII